MTQHKTSHKQHNKKELIVSLLKGIETGDPASVAVVNEAKYIQHNPQTQEGSVGLAELFKQLAKTSPKVNIVRVFEDGDFVFAHTEYDFARRNVGFEIFRFEDGHAVEHWDNIQHRQGPNSSGHSMVDGATEVTDLEKTEDNRGVIQSYVDEVLVQKEADKLQDYVNFAVYTEHHPDYGDDLDEYPTSICYEKCHRLLAEGNFVLSVCEGYIEQVSSSFFDLYRLEGGKIVEHWNTSEAIPARNEWKNDNGKF